MARNSRGKGKKAVVESEEEEEYTVEKILDRRERKDKVEYLLKWVGFPDSENTWEPEENLSCTDMITAFENKRKEDEKKLKKKVVEKKEKVVEKKEKVKRPLMLEDPEMNEEEENRPAKKKAGEEEVKSNLTGFDRNLVPEKIIGATDNVSDDGELHFLMKWKNRNRSNLRILFQQAKLIRFALKS
uniref:Chromo domain-containing protein n=1 Tax=Daphnia galeata TaxID=27404 RepID=A0A8J2RWF3_9CRUS|nr:unnamed protein product [Daphnia galeata]